ncbi:MAG: hypothetical protein ACR9NN_07050 [Nostochopsis sp.]
MTNIKQRQQKKRVIGITKGIPNRNCKKAVNILMFGGSDTAHFQVNRFYTSLELSVQTGVVRSYAPITNVPISNPERIGSGENKKKQCHIVDGSVKL